MRSITNFVAGLFFSLLFLLPISAYAAELQPFFTLKTSSVNTLVSVAEKVATMADIADDPTFREVVKTAKEVQGFDLNGIIGIAAAVNENGSISPILLLPITDLWKAEITNFPNIFDSIRPFLERKGAARTHINTPLGQTFVALQKQGYLVITSEDAVEQLPADPKKLFADLEKFTLGCKFDLEKVEFETLETNLFAPMVFMAAMQNPAMGEQFENMVEMYRALFKEFGMVSYGIAFEPRSANVEIAYTVVPRKGSDTAKSFVGQKLQPTIFNGFRGVPSKTIFALGGSSTYGKVDVKNNPMMADSMKQLEAFIEGLVEQVAMEDESGESTELAHKFVDSILKIVESEAGKGANDSALSFNTEGTLLVALDVASLAEIQKFVAMLIDFGSKKIGPTVAALDIDIKALVKHNYVTIEGFNVSSFNLPMDKLAPFFSGHVEGLKDLTPGVFWAVKDAGGKQAIAVAAGIDFAKAEQAFKSALEQTKTSAPVQKPIGFLSVQEAGKFVQQTVYPMVEKARGPDAEIKKVLEIFASAGNEATVTLDGDLTPEKAEISFRISGKTIQAIVSIAKIAAGRTGGFARPAQDF